MTTHLTNSDILRIIKRIDKYQVKSFELLNQIRDSDHPGGAEIYSALCDGQGLFCYYDCEAITTEILEK